jgi:hypothetical protein
MATATIEKIRSTNRKKTTKVERPLYSNAPRKGYTIDEVREMGYAKLSELYGVDIRKL